MFCVCQIGAIIKLVFLNFRVEVGLGFANTVSISTTHLLYYDLYASHSDSSTRLWFKTVRCHLKVNRNLLICGWQHKNRRDIPKKSQRAELCNGHRTSVLVCQYLFDHFFAFSVCVIRVIVDSPPGPISTFHFRSWLSKLKLKSRYLARDY